MAAPGSLGSGPGRRFEIPERELLHEVQSMLRSAGQRPAEKRTPEDHCRWLAYQVIDQLLAFLIGFKARVEKPGATPLRIVERHHRAEVGRLHLEFAIEVVSSEAKP